MSLWSSVDYVDKGTGKSSLAEQASAAQIPAQLTGNPRTAHALPCRHPQACRQLTLNESANALTVNDEGRPHANENRPSRRSNPIKEGRAVVSMPTTPLDGEPVPLGDLFARAMSNADGCATPSCDNVEPPRAAIPINDGWRCSYLCTDCGRAWTHDWKD